MLSFVIIYQSQRSITFPHTGGVVTPSFLRRFPAATRPQRRVTRLKAILSPGSVCCVSTQMTSRIYLWADPPACYDGKSRISRPFRQCPVPSGTPQDLRQEKG